MWKPLTGIAIVALGASAYFGYENRNEYRSEVDLHATAESNLDKKSTELEETQETLKSTNETIASVESDIETTTDKKQEATAKIAEVENKLSDVEKDLESKLEEIAGIEKIEKELGSLEQIEGDIESAEAELASVEQEILAAENAKEIAVEKIAMQDKRITDYQSLQRDQANGIIRGNRPSSIREVYGDYGFVVLSAGDGQGYVPKAKLDVRRGGEKIASLTVTNVEPGYSVASIDKGSLVEGNSIQPGDVAMPATSSDSTGAKPKPKPKPSGAASGASGGAATGAPPAPPAPPTPPSAEVEPPSPPAFP